MSERLSALDASFLAVESPAMPMHVGWVARSIRPSTGRRRPPMSCSTTSRRGWSAPTATARSWPGCRSGSTSPCGSTTRSSMRRAHLHAAGAWTSTRSSTRCSRRRCGATGRCGRCGSPTDPVDHRMIGKVHHCMVDGTAVVELGNLMLDADPDAADARRRRGGRRPRRRPARRLGRAIADRIGETAALVAGRAAAARRARARAARARAHGRRTRCCRPRPARRSTGAGSARRHHVRVTRSLDDLRAVRRRFGVTPNDVVLAACAGALRRFAERRGERRGAQGDGAGRRPHGRRRRRRAATASRSCSSSCRATSPTRSRGSTRSARATAQRRRDGRGRAARRRLRHARADARRRCSGCSPTRSRTRACSTSRSRASPARPCRATCAAAGCARCTPPCRSAPATRSRSAS